jgi:hypothetical protein
MFHIAQSAVVYSGGPSRSEGWSRNRAATISFIPPPEDRDRLVRHTPHLGPTHNLLLSPAPAMQNAAVGRCGCGASLSVLSVQQRASEMPLLGTPADNSVAATTAQRRLTRRRPAPEPGAGTLASVSMRGEPGTCPRRWQPAAEHRCPARSSRQRSLLT